MVSFPTSLLYSGLIRVDPLKIYIGPHALGCPGMKHPGGTACGIADGCEDEVAIAADCMQVHVGRLIYVAQALGNFL